MLLSDDEVLTPKSRLLSDDEVAPAGKLLSDDEVMGVPATWGDTLKAVPQQIAGGAQQAVGGLVQSAAAEPKIDPIVRFLPPQLQVAALAKYGAEKIQHAIVGDENIQAARKFGTDTFAAGAKRIEDATPENQSFWQQAVSSAGVSAGTMLPAGIAAFVLRQPGLVAGTFGVQEFGRAYGDAKAKGLDDVQAARHATASGLLEAGTEYLPAKALFKTGTGPFKRLVNFMARELPGENIAELGQMVSERINGMDDEITAQQVIDTVKMTSAATLITGGSQSIAASGLDYLARHRSKTPEEKDAEAITAITSAPDVDTAITAAMDSLDTASLDEIQAEQSLEQQLATLETPATSPIPTSIEGAKPEVVAPVSPQNDPSIYKGVAPTPEQQAETVNVTQNVPESVTGARPLNQGLTSNQAQIPAENVTQNVPAARRRFQQPDEYAEQIHLEKVAKHQLNPEAAADFAPNIKKNKLDYFADDELMPAMERAQKHREETGEEAHIVYSDIFNMGGGNEYFAEQGGEPAFDEKFFIPMAHKFVENLRKTAKNADVVPIRVGGDELAHVVVNASEGEIQSAMKTSMGDISKLNKDLGLSDIKHKSKPDSPERGVGLYYGIADIEPGMALGDILKSASRKVAINKLERKGVRKVETEISGAVPSGGQAGRTEGRIAAPGSGVSEQEASQAASQTSERGDKGLDENLPVQENNSVSPEAPGRDAVPAGRETVQEVRTNPRAEGQVDEQRGNVPAPSAATGLTGSQKTSERGLQKAIPERASETQSESAGTVVPTDVPSDNRSGADDDLIAELDSGKSTETPEQGVSSLRKPKGPPRFFTAKQASDRGYISNVSEIDEFNGHIKTMHAQGREFDGESISELREITKPKETSNGNTQESEKAAQTAEVLSGANEAATSPENDLPEPSQAQRDAGNFKMGHTSVGGMDVTIEVPKGGERKGKTKYGKEWSVTMPAHYGYLKRTEGADGEHIDVYVGDTESDTVYVIDQVDADGRFDEHKAILGHDSEESARATYEKSFNDGKGKDRIGAVTKMSMDEFKAWAKEGDTKKPVGKLSKRESVKEGSKRQATEKKSSDPKYSKQAIASGIKGPSLPVKRVQEIVDEFMKDVDAAVRVTVQPTQKAATNGRDVPDTIKAAFTGDELILIAENLKGQSDVEATLRHEIFFHYGFSLFPAETQTAIEDEVNATRADPKYADTWQHVLKNYDDASRSVQAQEFLAKLAETEKGRLTKLYHDVLALIQAALRKLGWKGNITQSEIQALLNAAERQARRGGEAGVMEPAYSKATREYSPGKLTDAERRFFNTLDDTNWEELKEAAPSIEFDGEKISIAPEDVDGLTDWIDDTRRLHESGEGRLPPSFYSGDFAFRFRPDSPGGPKNQSTQTAPQRAVSVSRGREVIRQDEHGKDIVWERGDYFIAVDSPNDAEYITLWYKNKRVGAMSLTRGRSHDLRGYKAVANVEIDKSHRGQGLGTQMYRAALKYIGDQYKGIGGENEQRSNKRQVPAIYRSLGGMQFESGDFVIDKPGGTFDPSNPNILYSKQAAPIGFQGWTLPNTMSGTFSSLMTKKDKLMTTARQIRRKMQDKFIVWRDVQEEIQKQGGTLSDFSDAYNKFTLIEGKIGDRFKKLFDDHIQPIIQDLTMSGVTIEQLGDYLYAKFAPQRNKRIADINPDLPDGGSGLTNAEAQKILAGFTAAETQQLERIAQKVYAMQRFKLDTLVDAGRLTAEVRDELLKDDRYVPLKGFADTSDLVTDSEGIGRGFDQAKDVFKRAKGRKSLAAELLSTSVRDVENGIISAEKNRVGQAVLKMVMDNPNENLWKVNPIKIEKAFNKASGQVEQRTITDYKALARDPNVFVTWVKGKPYAIEFRDNPMGESALARAVKNMGVDNIPKWATYLSKLNRWLSMANTALSPEFLMTNPIRDIQTALAKTFGDYDARIAGNVLKNLPNAIRGAIGGIGESKAAKKIAGWNPQWTAYYKEYAAEGGKTDYFRSKTVDEMRDELESELKAAAKGTKGAARRAFRHLYRTVENGNAILENMTRLSLYITLREAGYSKHKSATAAKNASVNFNRKGEAGAFINSLYLFYNASIQGTALTLRLMRNPKVQKLLVAAGAGMVALTQFNILAGGDDDDGEANYFKIPEYERERNIIIMWPDGSGRYSKFPMPYGLNVPMNAAASIAHVANGQDPLKQAVWLAGSAWNSFSPVGENGWNIVAPTVLDPFVDLALNRNYADSQIMPEKNPFDALPPPDSERAFSSTHPGYKAVAKFMNDVTGGNEQKPGWLDISPESIQHLAETYTGAAGGFLNRVTNYATDPSLFEKEPARAPFIRKFYGEPSPYSTSQSYRDNKAHILYFKDRMDFLKDSAKGDPLAFADVRKFREDNREGLMLAAALDMTEKNLKRLYGARKKLEAAGDKAAVEKINERIAEMQTRFNTRYNDVFLDRGIADELDWLKAE